MSKDKEKKRDEALVERLMRRVLEGMGSVVDRKLGREADTQSGFTTSKLIERMKRLIEERTREDEKGQRLAPHLLKLKVEWGTHSEAPPEYIKELETEVLAAAIDYINDQRLRTLAPVKVETTVDIFTTGIAVDPSYGEFEEKLREEDEARRRAEEGGPPPPKPQASPEVRVAARVTLPKGTDEKILVFRPGGKRLNAGRVSDNDLQLDHPSVSKIHASLVMNREGTLLVADTGSTNGTFVNGRRIAYGEARHIEDGDVIGFGDVEVRFKKNVSQKS
ncbi:MAG: FHA domain-containing protein [Acidobacteria bacterium]|nr:FHA domain-containing protein [Acidobacteriota bacterium]